MRGPKINGFLTIVRSCQDVMGTFVFGAVFERHPDLKVVCAEADAGWVPHYMLPHGPRLQAPPQLDARTATLSKLPSEYFAENIYVTFQDDWVAFKVTHLMNVERLMWANDFPHSDSTWPWSQEMLAEHTAAPHRRTSKRRILHDNVAELYGLDRAATDDPAMRSHA